MLVTAAAAAAPRADFLEGVVRGPGGPEAGVWVIAETHDLPTKYVKIVMTDDAGRYVLPELPAANYEVWVRGYGLIDSPKTKTAPGRTLDLAAVPAPDAQAAAHYYPAGHWFSLLGIPKPEEFPGTGPAGNGIAPTVKNQAQYLRLVKSGGCLACHALGTQATRELPPLFRELGSAEKGWERRVLSGQAAGNMVATLQQIGRERALKMFSDWTERIARGAVPPAPRRPQGIERNVVITEWDWADPKAYLHDLVTTDRRHPTVNANGLIYGALELSADYLPVLDPVRHTTSRVSLSVRDPATRATSPEMPAPSPYNGDTVMWTSRANVHNPMFDHLGRVWITATVRPPENPPEFRSGSGLTSAKFFPLERSGRQLGLLDPRSGKYTTINTGFSTHHLMFAEDDNNTLWTSGGGPVVGWFNTKKFDETGDEIAAQGWTALILDTNGNGQRDDYVEPNRPLDPAKDKRIAGNFYAVAPAPDGSVWGSVLGYPGALIRLNPGANPPATALAEIYELPVDEKGARPAGYRGSTAPATWDVLCMNHYWSKSNEDLREKVVRGFPLPGFPPRDLDQHLRWEREMNAVEDRAILPLWEMIKSRRSSAPAP